MICLTLFALQTKIDFTACGGVLLALILVLIIGSLLFTLLPSRAFLSENRRSVHCSLYHYNFQLLDVFQNTNGNLFKDFRLKKS